MMQPPRSVNVSVLFQRERNLGRKDLKTRAMRIKFLIKKLRAGPLGGKGSFPNFTEDEGRKAGKDLKLKLIDLFQI
jgi:hypothetical protein